MNVFIYEVTICMNKQTMREKRVRREIDMKIRDEENEEIVNKKITVVNIK